MSESSAAERLARRFHELYEELAPDFGYTTRLESAVPWDQVPQTNRELMAAVCGRILDDGLWASEAATRAYADGRSLSNVLVDALSDADVARLADRLAGVLPSVPAVGLPEVHKVSVLAADDTVLAESLVMLAGGGGSFTDLRAGTPQGRMVAVVRIDPVPVAAT